jgi:hypothetical protein
MLIFVRLRTIYFLTVNLLTLSVLQVKILNTGWWIWKNLESNDQGPIWGFTQAFGRRDKKSILDYSVFRAWIEIRTFLTQTVTAWTNLTKRHES